MVRKFLFILSLLLSATNFAYAQGEPKPLPISDCGERPKVEGNNPDCFKPVTFGKDNDGFPKVMKVKGVVTRVTMLHISCGILCHWGTAEIKLLKKPKGYDHDYLYVTVLCFSGKPEDFVNKIIEQKVVKTEEFGHSKWCGGVYNFLDSQGKPFYDLFDNTNRSTYKLRIVGDYQAQRVDVACK